MEAKEKCIVLGCSNEATYMNRCDDCNFNLDNADFERECEGDIDYRDIIDPQMQEF